MKASSTQLLRLQPPRSYISRLGTADILLDYIEDVETCENDRAGSNIRAFDAVIGRRTLE